MSHGTLSTFDEFLEPLSEDEDEIWLLKEIVPSNKSKNTSSNFLPSGQDIIFVGQSSTAGRSISSSYTKLSQPNRDPIEAYPVCHPKLETLDPTPNLWHLYRQFDTLFFEESLSKTNLEVSWSKSLTSCAGIFSVSVGGIPQVQLSYKLLRLRPRSDLVNTLIHEMIHAYIWIHQLNDSGEHGNIFCQFMNRINQVGGTNVTVYHNFHDEVQYYQYVWKCNGSVCRNNRYYIRRAINRKPNAGDFAFRFHRDRHCDGQFVLLHAPPKIR